ncbi:hypothetical protein [Nocardiopsis listeri]|nr:hypothetical protein [Nocardiopsis listeri]
MIVPVEDPDNCSREEIIAAYLERGFSQEEAEAFTAILKDPPEEGIEIY